MIIVSQGREIALNMRYVHDFYIEGKEGNRSWLTASTDDEFIDGGTTLGEYDSLEAAQTAFDALCRAFDGPHAVAYVMSAEDAKRGARE